MKIVEIPNVRSLILILLKLDLINFSFILDLEGKKSTDSGKYLYASDLDRKLAIFGKI